MKLGSDFDVVVIGGGHAGVEAALAAARMGCSALLLSPSPDDPGALSCNPAIGGTAKGHLVKEVDALGGAMGLAADHACIHFRTLNRSKGQAVRSSRAQVDRGLYRGAIRELLADEPGVRFETGRAGSLTVEDGRIVGIGGENGEEWSCRACVVAAGTFLRGLIHRGEDRAPEGRLGEPAAVALAEVLASLGLRMLRFKTGTPPRLLRSSVDLDRLVRQEADADPVPFSSRTAAFDPPRVPCFLTATTPLTHRLVRDDIGRSPLYGGAITGTGARYCPSLEDKVMRFPRRESHPVTLEPEGLDSPELYAKGLGCSFPPPIQERIIRSVPGLERAQVAQWAYAVEYDVADPTGLLPTLESKAVRGLFLAGQANGTSGYEEAAAQGIWAGINAACLVQGRPPFLPDRSEAYVAVMVDDLVTRGTTEPYRMFTSRAEHRLLLREDNADLRLTRRAFDLGLVPAEEAERVAEKARRASEGVALLRRTRLVPGTPVDGVLAAAGLPLLKEPVLAADLLRRPEITLAHLKNAVPGLDGLGPEATRQVELEVKYEGYIRRQGEEVERLRKLESAVLPPEIDYGAVSGLSSEAGQKLAAVRPMTLGQASRVPGITPADVATLASCLKRRA